MKMLITAAALAIGLAAPACAQDDRASGQAYEQYRQELAQHRIDAFFQSVRDIPQYRGEPAWQAYAQYRGYGAPGAYAQSEIRDPRLRASNRAGRTDVQARRNLARDAYAQGGNGAQRQYVGSPARQSYAQARRNLAEDAYAQSGIGAPTQYVSRSALRAYAAQFREDVAQNPFNAYVQSGIRDLRLHLGYPAWHVYDGRGEYVGTDPDPFIRNDLARDPPLVGD